MQSKIARQRLAEKPVRSVPSVVFPLFPEGSIKEISDGDERRRMAVSPVRSFACGQRFSRSSDDSVFLGLSEKGIFAPAKGAEDLDKKERSLFGIRPHYEKRRREDYCLGIFRKLASVFGVFESLSPLNKGTTASCCLNGLVGELCDCCVLCPCLYIYLSLLRLKYCRIVVATRSIIQFYFVPLIWVVCSL